ncbi:MAG: dihydropteridine reductase [Clostridia bacterium]|nr:dihydropteridine reductase [Clostridia bacterium]
MMNKNDQQFIAQKIRTQYMEKESTELDALRVLDEKVKRPANIFAYVFGSIGAIVMGTGMSLVMTDIGSTLAIANTLPLGVTVGVVGLVMALINYPVHKNILNGRKRKYAAEILAISERIMGE